MPQLYQTISACINLYQYHVLGAFDVRIYDIIDKKRHGGKLTKEEIRFFIEGYTKGDIDDSQAAALAMAVCCMEMDDEEAAELTFAMRDSGDTVDLSCFGNLSADKHSTGGVGDKTTLIVAPIVAALGGKMAKMSGRGLGHTGGTIDKLESIKGFRTTLSREEFLEQTEKVGVAVIGQSENLAPADKKLYALRDVTATISSIPLIASSVMSKKLAAGAHSIVLDVKVGSGAFMKTREEAERLARLMESIGKGAGRQVSALITDMDSPLGSASGNALEVAEAVEVLSGKPHGRLSELCVTLSSRLASMCLGISEEEAEQRARDAVSSGAAKRKFAQWIEAQGGDASFVEDLSLLPQAKEKYEMIADRDMYIDRINAERIGTACVALGAGRVRKGDTIDHSTGVVMRVHPGSTVKKGDTIAVVHARNIDEAKNAEKMILAAFDLNCKLN